jgi:hypothetical protein
MVGDSIFIVGLIMPYMRREAANVTKTNQQLL